ncbi:MAG: iron uptake porin [Chamaesiphon sp.]|nr:iron uptake porin [Chamaesiphon sp.]
MTKLSTKILSLIPIGIAVWMAGTSTATANPSNDSTAVTPQLSSQLGLRQSSNPLAANLATEPTIEQLNQATESTEVRPSDWAYQTLQALNAKYSCSNPLTGDKTLSREEFATSLNGCIQSIEQLVARKPRRAIKKRRVVPTPVPEVMPQPAPEVVPPAPMTPPEPVDAPEEVVSQQDLDRLKGLVQSFASELQGVDSRLQAIEATTKKIQEQSFSTTTKLAGEVIIGINGYGGRTTAVSPTSPNNNTTLSNRVRLNFDTSFTGKDRLRTRLQSRNTTSFGSSVTGTNMTRLGFDGDEGNTTNLSLLQYSFPLSPQTKIIAETVGSEFNENMYTFNPILASSGEGSISRFGRFNPVYRLSGDGASLTVNHKFSDELGLAVGYAVPGTISSSPTVGNGLFSGSNSIISQLSFQPNKDLNLGLVYARSYTADGNNITGGTGSSAANRPFGSGAAPVATSANHYSLLASYKISPTFVLSGWAGLVEANREAAGGGTASSSNYALSFAFPDLGQKGNNLAFIVGVPPKLNSRNVPAIGTAPAITTTGNSSTSYHIEALYKLKLSDNLSITPGLLLITNPDHSSVNPTEYVGTIRTTFKF